jgi:riboflavin synthase
MFTGLIEEIGSVLRLTRRGEGAHLFIRARRVLEGTRVGDSIAVSGACLTVVSLGEGSFAVDCMPETLTRSTIGALRPGDPVNLERALALGDRLGGHLVLGHLDAVGEVLAVTPHGVASDLRISLPPEMRGYVAPKGSVAVDGISLTVTDVTANEFGLGIIPHTLRETTLQAVKPGRLVNLEADVLARYVRQALLAEMAPAPDGEQVSPRGDARGGRAVGVTEETLRTSGFLE